MTQSQEFSLFLGDWKVPLDITSLLLDETGKIANASRKEVTFLFRYREIPFSFHLVSDENAASGQISAPLGMLPYSAESAERRQAIAVILRSIEKDLGPILSVRRGKITLRADVALGTPVTAVGLLTAVTRFLLPLKPYIDLMAMVRMMA